MPISGSTRPIGSLWTKRFRLCSTKVLPLVIAISVVPVPKAMFAQSYDMDCKVILCLAGGFPAGCADARAYMIDRITRFPHPLPPFGFCAMSSGAGYSNYDAPYSYLNARDERGWHCPPDKQLHFEMDGNGPGADVTAFCYGSTRRLSGGSDNDDRIAYNDREPAVPVNFELQITLEPGTEWEYKSPLFRISYTTGFTAQVPSE